MPASCFGPYLRYAIATDFRDFFNGHGDMQNASQRLMLIVELADGSELDRFVDDMSNLPESEYFDIDLGPRRPEETNSRYATLRCTTVAVTSDSSATIWDRYASRVELSLPTKQAERIVERVAILSRAPQHGADFTARVLIGILDDGCPFASHNFWAATGPNPSTRVAAIWEQDRHEPGVPTLDKSGAVCQFGRRPPDFLYGCEFLRDSNSFAGGPHRHIGLNEWIELHTSPVGTVDEDGCYADAHFRTLKFRESHGAHVMDVLAGRLSTASRVSSDRVKPPSFAASTDVAGQTDIAFVQLPKACIEDPTGVWLDAYVLDGVRYIMSCSDGDVYDTVIINLSYGRTTGPHDGSALLEQALTEIVGTFDGANTRPELHIVLAAGNYYLTDSHVVFENAEIQPTSLQWKWRLPPDNAALCFAEVWMNTDDPDGVNVTLTSPSGLTFDKTQCTSFAGLEGPVKWGRNSLMWRLQVEATQIGVEAVQAGGCPRVTAEYGDYTIRVDGVPPKVKLHGYVARTNPNLDVLPGAKPSRFVDLDWERSYAAAASNMYSAGEFDDRGSLISRFHTLNGIGTSHDERVHVAGGYVLANRRKSSYSSAGPARGDPNLRRIGPDYLMLCDESYACGGVPGGGNRSGVVFRLVGTSAAAPQMARWIVRGHLPNPTDAPMGDVKDQEKRGGGNLEPP